MEKLSPLDYGRKACETIMKKYPPDKLPPYAADRNPPVGLFSYHQGVFLSGMNRIYQKCKDKKYFDYIKGWVDSVTTPDGKIIELGGWVSLETLDFRQPGILMFPLYEETGEEKYIEVVKYLAESLPVFPTNTLGGFWHMQSQPNQMWLDGLYMAGPVLAMYADKYNKPELLELVIKQVFVMWDNMRDEKTGLLRHGWDESKVAEWADPKTGLSQEVWGRAMGWFVTALADILDYIPKNHKDRDRLIEIEAALLMSAVKYQHEGGRFYQVLDKGGNDGNWLENSCTCLLVYAIAKSVKNGYIEEKYLEYAKKGYEGVISSLTYSDDGELLLGDVCIGTCIDSGDYKHYINRETCVNDLHGSGAFVLMCSEVIL